MAHLCGITTELLPQCEWGCVLCVGAPNLDDVTELLHLLV